MEKLRHRAGAVVGPRPHTEAEAELEYKCSWLPALRAAKETSLVTWKGVRKLGRPGFKMLPWD